MSEIIAPGPRSHRALLLWAVTATVAAFILGNLALFLWVRLRQEVSTNKRAVITRDTTASRRSSISAVEPGTSPFEMLQESDVIGRYRFFQDGVELGAIKLLPTHSIINKDGTTYPRYHWEIQPDGIMTLWQRGNVLFNVMEKPGVYVALKKDGTESMRIEKIEE